MQKIIIISLGGSLIVPKQGIDLKFLKNFKTLIEKQKNCRFILVCGGGRTARDYIKSAKAVKKISRDEADWLGIEATKLNANLVRTIFGDKAHLQVITDPTKKVNFKQNILIAAGWKPGCSTDYDAVLLAKTYNAKEVINLTDVDYLCDKNPKEHKDAKKILKTNWEEFQKIVGTKWEAGANMPFDPIATKEARKLKLKLILANGKKLKNLEKIIKGEKFIGSVVCPSVIPHEIPSGARG